MASGDPGRSGHSYPPTDPVFITDLQMRLAAVSEPTKKEWWETYIRGVIPFRGVSTAALRRCLAEWRLANGLTQLSETEQLAIILPLFAEPLADDKLADICARLIHRPERFAKTAVGWLLRDISRYEPAFVTDFLDANLPHFSLESARNATKYLDKSVQAAYVAGVKAGQSGR